MIDIDFIDRIRDYWRERGYAVNVSMRGQHPYSAIGSDLINGLPVGYRGDEAVSLIPPVKRGRGA